jgi:hypothetical protein
LGNWRGVIDTTIFHTNGIHHEQSWGIAPYHVVAVTGRQVADWYITLLALVDIIIINEPLVAGQWAGLQITYAHSLYLDYDRTTDTLRLFMTNRGIEFENARVGVGGLTNRAIFSNRSVNTSNQSNSDVLRASISVLPWFSTAVDVFDHLRETQNQSVNNRVYFGESFAEQTARFGPNNIVRGITADTGSNRLVIQNHFISVAGRVVFYPNNFQPVDWFVNYGFLVRTRM